MIKLDTAVQKFGVFESAPFISPLQQKRYGLAIRLCLLNDIYWTKSTKK